MKELTLAIPTKISINATTVLSLLNSIRTIKGYSVKLEILPGKSNIDQARSIMLTRWYDTSSDDDIFMFIDSDQTFLVEDIDNVITLNGDVNVGIYVNRANLPTCYPLNHQKFYTKQDNRLLYGATGFMAITRPILKKVIDYLKIENRMNTEPRFWIDDRHQNIIPFFTQRLIDSEINPEVTKKQWLGEDYGFCWLVRQCGGTIKGHLSSTIGHDINDIKYFDHVKNIPDTWDEKSVVYYMGGSELQWSANRIHMEGLGGSETAVIKLSEEWGKLGYNVTVFGNCPTEIVNNVKYIHFTKFKPVDNFNIIILWRAFGIVALNRINSFNKLYIDLHDMPYENRYMILNKFGENIDRIFVKSNFHKTMLLNLLNNSKISDKVTALENGILIDILNNAKSKDIIRNDKRLLYTSCYTRGLMDMLKYGYPYIKKHIPDIEFHICYGMDLVKNNQFKNEINDLLKQDGIVHHGRIGHKELSELRESCGTHYYIGHFKETDCISVKESLYSGLNVVVSESGVFKERSNFFETIVGDTTTKQVQENAGKYIVNLIKKNKLKNKRDKYEFKDWADVAKEWANIFVEKKIKYGIFKILDDVFIKKNHDGLKFNNLMNKFVDKGCNVNKFKIYNKPDESRVNLSDNISDNQYFTNITKNQILEYMSDMSIWNNLVDSDKLVLIMNDDTDICEDFIEQLSNIDFNNIDMLILTGDTELHKVENNFDDCSAYIMKTSMMNKISEDIQTNHSDVSLLEFMNRYVNIFNIHSTNIASIPIPVSITEIKEI